MLYNVFQSTRHHKSAPFPWGHLHSNEIHVPWTHPTQHLNLHLWAHWRHLANMIELVLPSAHPSPQTKQQINRFSHFCTAHGRVSSGTLASCGEYDCTCAQWHHLANTNECVLLSAHPTPQPKWQIDQFSCFCTTHYKKSLYFTMGDPFSKNCPFSWWIWTPHLLHDSLSQSELTIQTVSRSVQLLFVQMTAECPYTLQCDAPFPPQDCPFPWGIWTTWFLSLPQSSTQTASRSVQPFLQGSLV